MQKAKGNHNFHQPCGTENTAKPFKCETSGKTFVRKYNHCNHLRVHSEEHTYQSNMCDHNDQHKGDSTEHIRSPTDLCQTY